MVTAPREERVLYCCKIDRSSWRKDRSAWIDDERYLLSFYLFRAATVPDHQKEGKFHL
jgi:hypothetical protein